MSEGVRRGGRVACGGGRGRGLAVGAVLSLLGGMLGAASLVPGAAVASPPAFAASSVAGSVTQARSGSAPPAPVGLRVPALALDAASISLVWSKPDGYQAIADYHVYRDGVLIGSASQADGSAARTRVAAFYADAANAAQYRVVPHHFRAAGLKPDTRYRFTVRSVNAAGVESKDSAAVTQSTTAVSRVFNVVDYGAVGDGVTVNTTAIQAAIDATTPGGTVLVPAGVFQTGAIWLKSDLTFEVAQGATLLGSENPADYPYHFRLFPYSTDERFQALINAQTYTPGGLRNIRIVGPGTIDGNGWLKGGTDADGYPVAAPSTSATVSTNGVLAKAQVALAATLGSASPYGTRSNLIDLRGVTNAYYGGFTATNPSGHTLVNIQSKNVTVDDVTIETVSDNSSASGNNADGVEFVNSTGLTVFDSLFDTGDDSVNLNAGLGAASASATPASDVWVFDNYFHRGHGMVVGGSFTGAWIQDVLAEDNVGVGADVGLRLKTAPTNGGGARRVLFRDSALKNLAAQGFIVSSAYSDPNAAITVEPAPTKARFTDITVSNVTVDSPAAQAIVVTGVADQYHQKLRFDGVRFLNARPAAIQYLKASSFTDVTFDHTPAPWVITNSTGLRFAGGTAPTPVTEDAESPPRWPAGSTLTAATPATTSVALSWTPATDDTAVASYLVTANGRTLATVPGTATAGTVTGLSPALHYGFTVLAKDATGNLTSSGPKVSVTTAGPPDTVRPVVPTAPDAVAVPTAGLGITWTRITWTAATDDVALKGYDVYLDGKKVATPAAPATSTVLTGLKPATAYRVTVRAVDGSGNTATYPAAVSFTTLPAVVLVTFPIG